MAECGGLENRLTLYKSYEGSNPSSSARNRIILSGFMGAGKTTVGKLLNEQMRRGIAWLDLDEYIEEAYEQKISDIFHQKGEQYFRDLEHEMLMFLLDLHPQIVVSAGGGTLIQDRNIQELATKDVTIIFLDVPFEVAYQRIKNESDNRALATSKTALRELYDKRYPVYMEHCDYYISADAKPQEICDVLLSFIEEK